jgi:hypothetical protein
MILKFSDAASMLYRNYRFSAQLMQKPSRLIWVIRTFLILTTSCRSSEIYKKNSRIATGLCLKLRSVFENLSHGCHVLEEAHETFLTHINLKEAIKSYKTQDKDIVHRSLTEVETRLKRSILMNYMVIKFSFWISRGA